MRSLLPNDEIDLWRSVQNFEYNIEDSSTIIRERLPAHSQRSLFHK